MLVIALGLALLCVPKGDLHITLCDHHTPWRDLFFRYYTQGAEWLPYVVCLLIWVFCGTRDGITSILSVALAGLMVQALKWPINAARPKLWFSIHMPDVTLPAVEGVRMHEHLSFPSGHTATFFALAFVLSIVITKRLKENSAVSFGVQSLLFFLAVLGGYSRIYLSQHFALDVTGGLLVGLLTTLLVWVVSIKIEQRK